MFKAKSPEEQAAKEARRAAEQAQREREMFARTPVGQARAAFEHGDRVFQYAQDVASQQAVIVAMIGSTSIKRTADPSEILNAVCDEGWELVNGSFVFVAHGEQSRESSGPPARMWRSRARPSATTCSDAVPTTGALALTSQGALGVRNSV